MFRRTLFGVLSASFFVSLASVLPAQIVRVPVISPGPMILPIVPRVGPTVPPLTNRLPELPPLTPAPQFGPLPSVNVFPTANGEGSASNSDSSVPASAHTQNTIPEQEPIAAAGPPPEPPEAAQDDDGGDDDDDDGYSDGQAGGIPWWGWGLGILGGLWLMEAISEARRR